MIIIEKTTITAAILDMDGVLWRSDESLCDLKKLFSSFEQFGVKVLMATNNGLSTVDQYIYKFDKLGVQIEPWQVLTSAIAVGYLVKQQLPNGGPVYIMGEQALFSTLEEFNFYHSENEPQAVIAGLTKKFTYEMLKNTSLAIQKGIPFYFTNPDPSYPSPEGNIPGAGTILAALETASGIKAILAGKPLPFLFNVGIERLNSKPSETLVVGDRLSTDILGGQQSGCRTALVLTGISTRADYENWSPKPDLLLNNIMDLFSL
ncbi:MAG: HAD-IIA family hydrolase [Pelolinea sp.]|nr:HAD-IIA family hydrolase [Pelolinea sp.]